MLIYEGEHKCVTLTEVSELESFLLEKAVKRNGGRLDLQMCLDKVLVKETNKDLNVMTNIYKVHGRVVMKTELSVVNPHKGSLFLKYKVMDWS